MKKVTLLLALLGTIAACNTTPATSPITNVAFDGELPQRSFRFDYKADLAAESADEELRLWLPLPSDTDDQQIGELTIEASHAYKIEDLVEGTGRSLYIESTGEDISVAVHFDVTRHATAGGGSASASEIAIGLTSADMIPLGGKVSAMSASIAVNEDGNNIGVAKALYDHTSSACNTPSQPMAIGVGATPSGRAIAATATARTSTATLWAWPRPARSPRAS